MTRTGSFPKEGVVIRMIFWQKNMRTGKGGEGKGFRAGRHGTGEVDFCPANC